MESKQFNKSMPLFAHAEFEELSRGLRRIGTKPTDGDLIAALIHSALTDIEGAKAAVEAFVVYELGLDDRDTSDAPDTSG